MKKLTEENFKAAQRCRSCKSRGGWSIFTFDCLDFNLDTKKLGMRNDTKISIVYTCDKCSTVTTTKLIGDAEMDIKSS